MPFPGATTFPGSQLHPGPDQEEDDVATVATLRGSESGTQVAVSNATAGGGGDKFAPGTRVHVVNGGGAPITATIATPKTERGLSIDSRAVTIPNGSFPANCKFFDVPNVDTYIDPADGLVNVTWSSATSVTFWVEGPVISA